MEVARRDSRKAEQCAAENGRFCDDNLITFIHALLIKAQHTSCKNQAFLVQTNVEGLAVLGVFPPQVPFLLPPLPLLPFLVIHKPSPSRSMSPTPLAPFESPAPALSMHPHIFYVTTLQPLCKHKPNTELVLLRQWLP